MLDLIEKIELMGYDWLVRSNQHLGPRYQNDPEQGGRGKYFANITLGSSPDPTFQTSPAWGTTAEEALRKSYTQLITRSN